MKLRVCCFSDYLDGNLPELMKSIRGKIVHIVHMESEGWDWTVRVEWQLKICQTYPEDILIFLDSYDCLFIGDVDELKDLLEKLLGENTMLLSTTKNCWPHPGKRPYYEAKDPTITSPWRYVNGMGPTGKGHVLAKALKFGIERFPIKKCIPGIPIHNQEDVDQRFWTDIYLSGYGTLDHQCEMSQNLAHMKEGDLGFKDKRLINTITGSRPHFLHAAAGSWIEIPDELLPK